MSIYKKSVLVLIISGFLFAGIVFIPDIEPLEYVRTHFFSISDSMKFIFYFSIFVILFLVLFLISIFKPQPIITKKVSETLVSETDFSADFSDETEEFEEISISEISFLENEELEEDEEITDIDEIEETNEAEENVPYTKIQLSKGLLKTASETLEKIKKEEIKTFAPVNIRKGLFKRANEFLKSETFI